MHPNTSAGEFNTVNTRAPSYVPPPPARSPDFFWQGPVSRGHLTRSESSQTLPVDSGVEHYRRPGKQNPPSYYDAIRTRHSLSHQDGSSPDARYYHTLQQQKYNSLPRPLPQRYSQFQAVQVEPPIVNGNNCPQEHPGKNWRPAVQGRAEDPRLSANGLQGAPAINGTSTVIHPPFDGPQVNGFGKPGSQGERDPYRQQNQHYQWTKTRILPPEGHQPYRIHHARANSETQLMQRISLPLNLQSYPAVSPPRETSKQCAPMRQEMDCPVPTVARPDPSSRKSDPVLKTPMRDPWYRPEYQQDVRRQAIQVPPRQAAPFSQPPPHPLVDGNPDRVPNPEWPLGAQVASQHLRNGRNRCQPRPPVKSGPNTSPQLPSGAIRPTFFHPPENNQIPRKAAALSPNGSGPQPNGMADSPSVSTVRTPPRQEKSSRKVAPPNLQSDESMSKGKSSTLASPSPWEREEKEKMRTKQLEKARRTRDNEIKKLEDLPNRTPRQEELLRTLRLEREFQRRAEEAHEDEDDEEEDDDTLLERAESRERMLMMQNEMERSRVQRLEKKIEELVRTKNQPLSPQEEWARRRMRQQLSQISEETDHQKKDSHARGHHNHHQHHHHRRHHPSQQNNAHQQKTAPGVPSHQENPRVSNGGIPVNSQVPLATLCPPSSVSSMSPPSSLSAIGENDRQDPSRTNYHQNPECPQKTSPPQDLRPRDPKSRCPAIPPRARNCGDTKNLRTKPAEEMRDFQGNQFIAQSGFSPSQEYQNRSHSGIAAQKEEIIRKTWNECPQQPPIGIPIQRGNKDYVANYENSNKLPSMDFSASSREGSLISTIDRHLHQSMEMIPQKGEKRTSRNDPLEAQQVVDSLKEENIRFQTEQCYQRPSELVSKNGSYSVNHSHQEITAGDLGSVLRPQHHHQRALIGDSGCHFPQQNLSLETPYHRGENPLPSRPESSGRHLSETPSRKEDNSLSEQLKLPKEEYSLKKEEYSSLKDQTLEQSSHKGHYEKSLENISSRKSPEKNSIAALEDIERGSSERNKRPLSDHTWTAKPVYLQSGSISQDCSSSSKHNGDIQKTPPPRTSIDTNKSRDWKSGLSSDLVRVREEGKKTDQQKLWESRPERLSFHEKVRKFAMQSGESDTPKDKVKHSRAQREIENRLNGVLDPEDSPKAK